MPAATARGSTFSPRCKLVPTQTKAHTPKPVLFSVQKNWPALPATARKSARQLDGTGVLGFIHVPQGPKYHTGARARAVSVYFVLQYTSLAAQANLTARVYSGLFTFHKDQNTTPGSCKGGQCVLCALVHWLGSAGQLDGTGVLGFIHVPQGPKYHTGARAARLPTA